MDITDKDYERVLVITELIKIVLNGNIDPNGDKVFNDLAISLKSNLGIDCPDLIDQKRKNAVDQNLAALIHPIIEKLKNLYKPYSSELKKIDKEEKNETNKGEKVEVLKEKLKVELEKIRSLLFAYAISENKEYFSKLDKDKISMRDMITEAEKFPSQFSEDLIPNDDEIISTRSHKRTKTPEELAIRYVEILFSRLGYNIGSDTYRREVSFVLKKRPEIEISDDQLALFNSKIRTHQNINMRNPKLETANT